MKKLYRLLGLAGLILSPLLGHSADYKEITVSNGGSISGKITFSGKDAPPKVYRVAKDFEACGKGAREIDYVEIKNGVLQNVVVYLDKVKEGKPFPAEVGDISVDQEACEFRPFLGVMRDGETFSSANNDPVLHNIHTYEMFGRVKKTVFNISQPDQNTISKEVSLKRGSVMKVECDAHDYMHAFVFVAKNPYFAVVDEEGGYHIDDVPPGKYKIKAWHGKLKDQKAEVKVTADGTATVDFHFKN